MSKLVPIDYPARPCEICGKDIPRNTKTGRRIGPQLYLQRRYCLDVLCRKEAAASRRRMKRKTTIVKKAKKATPVMIQNNYDQGYTVIHAPTKRFIASGLSHIEAREIQQALLTAAINWDFKDPEEMRESDRVQARAIIDQVLAR